jgi:hypothetical protein
MSLELQRQDVLYKTSSAPESRTPEEKRMLAESSRDVGIARDYVDHLKPRYQVWVKSQVPPQWAAEWPASLVTPP